MFSMVFIFALAKLIKLINISTSFGSWHQAPASVLGFKRKDTFSGARQLLYPAVITSKYPAGLALVLPTFEPFLKIKTHLQLGLVKPQVLCV